jgi:hypothetical protein
LFEDQGEAASIECARVLLRMGLAAMRSAAAAAADIGAEDQINPPVRGQRDRKTVRFLLQPHDPVTRHLTSDQSQRSPSAIVKGLFHAGSKVFSWGLKAKGPNHTEDSFDPRPAAGPLAAPRTVETHQAARQPEAGMRSAATLSLDDLDNSMFDPLPP